LIYIFNIYLEMGWQSYVIGYNTEEEKYKILEVIRRHNSIECNEPTSVYKDGNITRYEYEVGEELIDVQSSKFTKPCKQGYLDAYKYAILCGNGGGRGDTFRFFEKNNLVCEPFWSGMIEYLDMENNIDIEI